MIIGELPLFLIFFIVLYNSWFCITHHIALTVTRDIKTLAVKSNILEQVHWLGVSYLWCLVNIDPQQLKDQSHVHLVTLVIITAVVKVACRLWSVWSLENSSAVQVDFGVAQYAESACHRVVVRDMHTGTHTSAWRFQQGTRPWYRCSQQWKWLSNTINLEWCDSHLMQ